jgi:Flp pilus assembly protein CpaB
VLLALLVIVAFVLVALNASASNTSLSETVVVANRDLQPRVPITASDLTMLSIPVPQSYPKVYFEKASDLVGMVPLVGIGQNQAITANEVAKPTAALGSQSAFLLIPQGYVAMTIPTSEQQGVADYIQPGDYISMIATVSSAGKVASKTIFTQIHVLKVGTQSANTGGGSASSLTIVVTECEAEIITWFLTYAALKYTLESYHDYQPGDQAPDPKCPSVGSAQGVTLPVVKAAYPTLFS